MFVSSKASHPGPNAYRFAVCNPYWVNIDSTLTEILMMKREFKLILNNINTHYSVQPPPLGPVKSGRLKEVPDKTEI